MQCVCILVVFCCFGADFVECTVFLQELFMLLEFCAAGDDNKIGTTDCSGRVLNYYLKWNLVKLMACYCG